MSTPARLRPLTASHRPPLPPLPLSRSELCRWWSRATTEEEMAALMVKAREARDYHAEMQRLAEQRNAAKG